MTPSRIRCDSGRPIQDSLARGRDGFEERLVVEPEQVDRDPRDLRVEAAADRGRPPVTFGPFRPRAAPPKENEEG